MSDQWIENDVLKAEIARLRGQVESLTGARGAWTEDANRSLERALAAEAEVERERQAGNVACMDWAEKYDAATAARDEALGALALLGEHVDAIERNLPLMVTAPLAASAHIAGRIEKIRSVLAQHGKGKTT